MAWYDSNWEYRVKITTDNTKVDEAVTTLYYDLANLPAAFFTNVKSDGGDIRVTQSDGTTEVAREVVSIDTGAETGELHLDSTGVSTSADTDFYVYYGNSGASEPAEDATYGSENVWDSNYVAVYHMNDLTTSTIRDSTSNDNDGTKLAANQPIETTGQVGEAQSFDNTDDDIDVGSGTSIDNIWTSGGTVEYWVQANDGVNDRHMNKFTSVGWLISSGDVSGSDARVLFQHRWNGTTTATWQTSSRDLPLSTLTHIATSYDKDSTANDPAIYVGGASKAVTETIAPTGTADSDAAETLFLGNNSAGNRPLNGILDEVRLSDSTRSANWISTQFNCQDNNSAFWTTGAQEVEASRSPGGGVTVGNPMMY